MPEKPQEPSILERLYKGSLTIAAFLAVYFFNTVTSDIKDIKVLMQKRDEQYSELNTRVTIIEYTLNMEQKKPASIVLGKPEDEIRLKNIVQ